VLDSPRALNWFASFLTVASLVGFMGVLVNWSISRPMFAIAQVQVEGWDGAALRHVNGLTVRANVHSRLAGSFFTADLDRVRQSFESVPWVRRASVRREWPNRLHVELEEHRPVATWGAADSVRLVNDYGEVFVANLAEAEAEAELIALHGPEGTARDVMQHFSKFTLWFAGLKAKPIDVTLTERYAWKLVLSNNLTVELGREQSEQDLKMIEQRVQRFVNVWPQLVTKWGEQIEMADLRYPNGFAIRAAGMRFLDENSRFRQNDVKRTPR
jgi:cell division protein FtsQ